MDCGSCDYFELLPHLKQWKQRSHSVAEGMDVGWCHLDPPTRKSTALGAGDLPQDHITVWMDDWCSHWNGTALRDAERGLKHIEEELSNGL